MSDPTKIEEIQEAVTIPVMAKARIGHFVEAQVLQALEVDYIDESEVLTPADEAHHIDKWRLQGAVRLRRHQPGRGAAADRRGRGDDPHEGRGRHRQRGRGGAPHAPDHRRDPAARGARRDGAARPPPRSSRRRSSWCARWPRTGRLPVVMFCAGGIATPADAALMMQLGAEGVFVGSGIFKSSDPERRARAIVEATTHYEDPERVAAASRELGEPMAGLEIGTLEPRRRRAAPAPRLVSDRSATSASSPSRATSRRTRRALRGAGRASAREVRTPAELDGLDALVIPGGESHHDDARHRARGPRRAAARLRPLRASRCSAPAPG